MSYWSEIRNDFFNSDILPEEGDTLASVSIDGWRTEDDNEQGFVIARVILSKHGDVLVDYHDNIARMDDLAQEYIQDAISQLKEFFVEHQAALQQKTATPNSLDRFILINGQAFSFEAVAQALGLNVDSATKPVEMHLCQRIPDGVLVAKSEYCGGDDYPGIDIELELPAEKDTLPILISRTEQPREEGEICAVRTFGYDRENEYFVHFDTDTRPDAVLDEAELQSPQVVVSGERHLPVEVIAENPFVSFVKDTSFRPSPAKNSVDHIIHNAEDRAKSSLDSKEGNGLAEHVSFSRN